jgi:transcriptional regulator with XRE-family HTH domain
MADVAYIGPGGRESLPSAHQRRPRPLLRAVIGEVLRRNRVEQGRTLADVAKQARVSMPYLSELERGRKEASSEVLAAICDALRIELADVLTEAGLGLAAKRPVAPRPLATQSVATRAMATRTVLSPRRSRDQALLRDTGAPMRRPGDAVLLAA